MFARLGVWAGLALGGGGAASWGACGTTCRLTSERSDPARRTHGADTRLRRPSRDQRSPDGRRATALTSRTS
eukprot:5410440-Alexandrium_andersonii.AAC.1